MAAELEMPFGDDLNDLPVAFMQIGMNEALKALLTASQHKVPTYTLNAGARRNPVMKCPAALITEEHPPSPLRLSILCNYLLNIPKYTVSYDRGGKTVPTNKLQTK